MKIFFCGSILNNEGLSHYKGETPAASQWIRGFVGGLTQNRCEVTNISAVWDSLFPKGYLIPGKYKYLDNNTKQILVRYLNIPVFKVSLVANALYKAIKKEIAKGNKPDVIFNYNTYPHYVSALKRIKQEYTDIKWINVVLDLDDPEADNWQQFIKDSDGSDGAIFLSWWGYMNVPIKNKFHLDCGWSDQLPSYNEPSENIFIYAGKYAKFGGIDELIEVIKAYKNPEVKFYFFGKDKYSPLDQLEKEDSRVKQFGFVSDKLLDEYCKQATGFLSPREIDFQGTKMIFPSKILFYLKYRKPVISAMLPGLSPMYDEVLICPQTNDTEGWIESINKIVTMTSDDINKIRLKSEMLLNSKSWVWQSLQLIDFINKLV